MAAAHFNRERRTRELLKSMQDALASRTFQRVGAGRANWAAVSLGLIDRPVTPS